MQSCAREKTQISRALITHLWQESQKYNDIILLIHVYRCYWDFIFAYENYTNPTLELEHLGFIILFEHDVTVPDLCILIMAYS